MRIAVLALCLAAAGALADDDEERIGFGYSLLDDGGCAKTQQEIIGEYEREGDVTEIFGRVRTAPSGGDCERDALHYDVYVVRYFPVFGGRVDATVAFGASETSMAAPYALADEGGIIARADGGALFATQLPAGRAQTVTGALMLSREIDNIRLGAGANLVPVDWSDGTQGRTLHLTGAWDWRSVDLDAHLDIGKDMFGEISLTNNVALGGSRFDIAAGVHYRFGLQALDSGAPAEQDVLGARFMQLGAPSDTALELRLTLGYQL